MEPKDWHIQNFVYPLWISRTEAIKQNEIFGVKVGRDLPDIYFSASNENVLALWNLESDTGCSLLLSWFSCTRRWRLEREQAKMSLHTLALSHNRWYCFVRRARVGSHYVSWRRQMFFGSSRFLAVCLRFESLRNPTFVTETRSTCFWCSQGRMCFHLKRCLTGVPEEADNVFRGGYSSCPLPLFQPWWKASW